MLVQHLINALLLGGIYGCIGVGFSLIYGVMNIINLLHGSMIMLAAYTTYELFTSLHLDPFLSIPVNLLIFFVLGYLIQKYVNAYTMKSGVLMTMISTYGMALIVANLVLIIWQANYRAVTPSYAGAGLELGNVVVPYTRLGILLISFLLTYLLYLFMNKTTIGMAIQAVAFNKEGAELVGISVEHIQAITFGVSTSLASAAGAMLSMIYTVYPAMHNPLLGKAFVVAILGGLGNMYGAILGGLVLGIIETVTVPLFGVSWQNAVTFIIFVLILVIRPYGLIGKRFFAEI